MIDKKVIGLIGALMGIIGFSAISIIDKSKLVFNSTEDPFIVKYFIMIGLTNCCLFLFIYGFLQFLDLVVPYYSENMSDNDKAKNTVIGILLLGPIWISGTATVFVKSESILWRSIWTILILYLAFSIFNALKTLRKAFELDN